MQKFDTLVGKNHGLLAEAQEETHSLGLERHNDEEDCKSNQSTWAQIDQEDDQADDELDWSGPAHVEELCGEVDARNVGGDVVNQLSVGMNVTGASGERKALVVDRGDQSPA